MASMGHGTAKVIMTALDGDRSGTQQYTLLAESKRVRDFAVKVLRSRGGRVDSNLRANTADRLVASYIRTLGLHELCC